MGSPPGPPSPLLSPFPQSVVHHRWFDFPVHYLHFRVLRANPRPNHKIWSGSYPQRSERASKHRVCVRWPTPPPPPRQNAGTFGVASPHCSFVPSCLVHLRSHRLPQSGLSISASPCLSLPPPPRAAAEPPQASPKEERPPRRATPTVSAFLVVKSPLFVSLCLGLP